MKKPLLFFSLVFCVLLTNSQNDNILRVMKNGDITAEYNITTSVDSIIFYNPTVIETPIDNPNTYVTGNIPNAVYIGRWDTSAEYDLGYWAGTSLKVNFTGTTAKLVIDGRFYYNAGFAYSIDGGELQYVTGADIPNVYGPVEINLTPTPLSPGEHTLTIANGNGQQDNLMADEILRIKELLLDPGAESLAPTHIKPKMIEFIGDSITMGFGLTHETFSGYAWLISSELGLEHSNVSESGKTLSEMTTFYDQHYWTLSNTTWDQSIYHPDLIFINLMQNGGNAEQYETLLRNLRGYHPNAIILCMKLLDIGKADASEIKIQTALDAINDPNMHLVKADGLLINGTENDFLDSVWLHPNDSGNRKLANHFKPIIANYLGL